MNNIKKFIKSPLIVLIISALIGGFFGSYFTYHLNNLSTEKRNNAITRQIMLFIHNEIYENYVYKLQDYSYSLLGVEGLDLTNLIEGDLTIKDEQLAYIIRMYGYFRIFNLKMNKLDKAQNSGARTWVIDSMSKDLRDWEDICVQKIEEYEEEFCKGRSLISVIEVE